MKKSFLPLIGAVSMMIAGCDSGSASPEKTENAGKAKNAPEQIAQKYVQSLPSSQASPSSRPAAKQGVKASCVNDLRQIGTAIMMYWNDHNGNAPAKLNGLQEYGINDKMLKCGAKPYKYSRPSKNAAADTVIVRCEQHGLNLFMDGSVRSK